MVGIISRILRENLYDCSPIIVDGPFIGKTIGIICAGFNNKDTLPPLPTTLEGFKRACSPNQGAQFDTTDVKEHPGNICIKL